MRIPTRGARAARISLSALLLVPALLVAQAAGGVRPMLLHAAPDSGYVYLSWNLVPGVSSYQVDWRRQSTEAWQTREVDSASYSTAVSGLENDVAYEFRVRASARDNGATYASPTLEQTPRLREECADAQDFACALDGLARLFTSSAGGMRFLCDGVELAAPDENTRNCAYYSGTRVFGFDRYYGQHFVAPPNAAPRAVVRRAARRAIWGDQDPFAAPEQFHYEVRALAHPYTGLVLADSVASYIIRMTVEVSSRFTIYRPRDPVPGRYVIYHEGHGLTANTSGADFINWFLLKGWTVVGMDMPLEGDNAPDARYPFDSHDALRWYRVASRHALELFLLPVKVVVDRVVEESRLAAPTIVLAGRSGGGWTTCMYGAVDERITIAIDISGCVPRSVALDSATLPAPNVMHFETLQPVIFDQVSMLEFITAAGTRGSFHFFSENDPSFRVRPSDPYALFLDGLRAAERASPRTRDRTRVHVGTQPVHGLDAAGFDALAQFMRDVGVPVSDRTPAVTADTWAAP